MAKFLAGSNSRLELFETCPHWFKLQNLDRVPAPPSPALELGIAAHEFFAAYVLHCVENKQRSDLAWAQAAVATHGPKLRPAQRDDLEQIVERFCASYLVDPAGHVGVEVEAAFDREWRPVDWKDWDNVYFRSKMDRVLLACDGAGTTHLVVEDFKTDRRIDSRQTVETSSQLQRYAFAASLLYPVDVGDGVKVRLQYARYGVEREAFVPADRLPGIRREIEEAMVRLNAEKEWKPNPGAHCGYCPYTTRCALFSSTWGSGTPLAIENALDATQAAGKYLYLKGLIREYEARLRAHATGNGEILLATGEKLGFKAVKKLSFENAAPVVQALLDAGVDRDVVWSAVGVSKTGVEKALKSLGRGKLKELWPQFEALSVDATETWFTTYRDKEEVADAA